MEQPTKYSPAQKAPRNTEKTQSTIPPQDPRGPTVKGPGGRAMRLAPGGRRFDARSGWFLTLALLLLVLGSLLSLWVEPTTQTALGSTLRPSWWVRPVLVNAPASLTELPAADIQDLFVGEDGTLFAAAEGGLLYRRLSGAPAWSVTVLPEVEEAVLGFFDRGKFALGCYTREGRLWISDDKGATWEAVPETVPEGQSEPILPNSLEDWRRLPQAAAKTLSQVLPKSGEIAVIPIQVDPPEQLTIEQSYGGDGAPGSFARTLPEALRSLDPDVPEGEMLADLAPSGKDTYLAVSRRGQILITENGGVLWESPRGGWRDWMDLLGGPLPDVMNGLTPFQFQLRNGAIWALGTINSDYRSAFGAETALVEVRPEEGITVEPCPDLMRFAVAPDGSLWGFNAGGLLFRRPAGGATMWEDRPLAGDPVPPVRALTALDANTAVVGGLEGRIWEFDWETNAAKPLTRNALEGPAGGYSFLLPPPLFIIAALGLLAGVPRLLRRPPRENEIEDIAEVFVSDRPLKQSDVDYLNFGPYVRGLSSYLRNTSTQPPLTVAVTGAWGSGKTSMMSLLKEDLEGRGFCPVWFNAWHHQRDDGLLAALLQTVKAQAVPPPTNREGLHYRWRLFFARAKEQKLRSSLSLLTFIVGLTGFAVLLFDPGFPLLAAIDTFVTELIRMNEEGFLGYLADLLTVFSGGALLAPLLYVLKTLRSFGVKPSALLASSEGQASRRQLDEKAGFRHRFSNEFGEVADALLPLSLVIMIDDLDRCEPTAVFEVLEAINFLSSSGKCFIVLGMDEERVQDCVAANCRKMGIVPPRFHNGTDTLHDEHSEYRDALEFARAYMEKMIQVRIAVPTAEAKAAARLVAGEEGKPFAEPTERAQWPAWLRPLGAAAALIGALGIGLGGANLIKYNYERTVRGESAAVAITLAEKGPAVTTETPVPERAPMASDELFAYFEPWRDRVIPDKSFTPGRSLDLAMGSVLLLGAGIFLIGLPHLLAPSPSLVVKDTKEFTEAARTWAPLVFARNPTPRNLKAFLNRVRYYAMLLRGDFGPRGAIPEGMEASLVAFAAVEHAYPGWLRQAPEELKDRFGREPPPDQSFQDRIVALRDSSPMQEYRSLFQRFSKHVRM